jgi:UDP-2,3-diacylglucosamine hydrolase
MTKLFISDLHLDEKTPRINKLFLDFLKDSIGYGKELYILGDFFEFWIGDDHKTEFNKEIIGSLKNASTEGLKIFFMQGNRDFLIGRRFIRESGCKLLPDYQVINLYSEPVLLMHGDILCTNDIDYQKFRKKARNWFIQKLFLMRSIQSRQNIVNKHREKIRDHVPTSADHIMDVNQAEVERVMHQHKVQHLIHGHTHRQNIHHFLLNGKPAKRTVLGPWHENGNALVCKEDGSQEFILIT